MDTQAGKLANGRENPAFSMPVNSADPHSRWNGTHVSRVQKHTLQLRTVAKRPPAIGLILRRFAVRLDIAVVYAHRSGCAGGPFPWNRPPDSSSKISPKRWPRQLCGPPSVHFSDGRQV